MTGPLHYEDFEVGQQFASSSLPMDRDRLVAFAAEFDPQPAHLDETQAKASLFGTLVASGWHTAALTMRLQLDAMFGRIPGGAMGAQIDTLAWRRPVLPNDQLHVVIVILSKRLSKSRPDRGLLSLKTTTYNQDDEAVLEMTAAVLVPRRQAAA